MRKCEALVAEYADDIVVIRTISGNEVCAYGGHALHLARWFSHKSLSLSTSKTKELIRHFREGSSGHASLVIHYDTVERVSGFKYLDIHLSEDATQTANSTVPLEKARQWL